MSEHLLVTDAPPDSDLRGIRTIRFARPEKKNALTLGMYVAFAEALRAADADDAVRVVVVTGAPGVFTAGNDIMDFVQAGGLGDLGPDAPQLRLLFALAEARKPIVGAVDGPATGIGTTMLLHFDVVVVTARTRFQLPFVNLGLVPEAAASLLLPAVVGLQRASEWLLTGEPFDAAAAHGAGLVNAIVEPDALEATAYQRARAIAARPPQAVQLSKWLVREPLRAAVKDAIVREGRIFAERLQTEEAANAFTAFLGRK